MLENDSVKFVLCCAVVFSHESQRVFYTVWRRRRQSFLWLTKQEVAAAKATANSAVLPDANFSVPTLHTLLPRDLHKGEEKEGERREERGELLVSSRTTIHLRVLMFKTFAKMRQKNMLPVGYSFPSELLSHSGLPTFLL